jgi:hypothetical protein
MREDFKVEIVDSIDKLLEKVDVVLLESVDGRPHLKQAEPVFKAKKKLFIDKPIAGSLADVIRIFKLGKEADVPVFSSSSLRFGKGIAQAKTNPKLGDITGCLVYAPCSLEKHHPDLFWYGVHGVEMVYTLMGPGCKTVQRTNTKDTDIVTGVWNDGRVATFRGIRGDAKADYGAVAFGTKGIETIPGFGGYEPLVVEIARFFRTGKAPVSAEETTEMFAFMEAADESKRNHGAAVTIDSVMRAALKEAERK